MAAYGLGKLNVLRMTFRDKRKAPWENEAIEEKRKKLEEAIELHAGRPTRANNTKLKRAREVLKSTYSKGFRDFSAIEKVLPTLDHRSIYLNNNKKTCILDTSEQAS